MDTHIKNHIGLMNFFQDWELPYIVDYYHAERDFLGQEYCRKVDHHYNKEQGISILKDIILEYPDAFMALIEKCYLDAPDELSLLLNRDNYLPEEEVEAAINFANYLLSDSCDENLRTISEALSKGFLLEWVVFHLQNKDDFVDNLVGIEIKDMYDSKNEEFDFEEWKHAYRKLGLTRQELIKKYQFRGNADCYLYYRIYLGYSLKVIFHALDNSLALKKREEDLFDSIKYFHIAADVQRFLESQHKGRNMHTTDSENLKELISDRIKQMFANFPDTFFQFDKEEFQKDLIKLLNNKEFFESLNGKRLGRQGKVDRYELSLRSIIGMVAFKKGTTHFGDFARSILKSQNEKATKQNIDTISNNLEKGRDLYNAFSEDKPVPSAHDKTICCHISKLLEKY